MPSCKESFCIVTVILYKQESLAEPRTPFRHPVCLCDIASECHTFTQIYLSAAILHPAAKTACVYELLPRSASYFAPEFRVL